MTEKRLFVGKKKCEDRFTIISDYDSEIGVKENRSGDVLVLKHSDLNAQQFVAQLVVFLNDQNQAIVDLYDGSKYWSDKATEKIKELEKENKELKAKVDDKEVAVEVECEKLMQKVFDLIDRKIKLYSHKPVSAPISQPMSVNFDADVDRLARLSELEALKKKILLEAIKTVKK